MEYTYTHLISVHVKTKRKTHKTGRKSTRESAGKKKANKRYISSHAKLSGMIQRHVTATTTTKKKRRAYMCVKL